MPFAAALDEVYYEVIKPTLQGVGLVCQRLDELPDPTHITSDIVNYIEGADLIIADLTNANPNVFYELAVAHSLNKPTVMIVQDIEAVPFDLQDYRVITYSQSTMGYAALKEQLESIALSFTQGSLRASNPVIDNLVKSPVHMTATMEDVLKIERDAIECVWVLAPDIELGPRYFIDVMHHNIIEKGIEYRYLVADDDEVKENLYAFAKALNLGDAASFFESRYIPQHLIESDVTIIDPNTSHEHTFILAPCEAPSYHFKVLGSHLFRLKKRFRELWKAAPILKL